jgi:hypothetical protein
MIEEKFYQLLTEWKKESFFISSVSDMVKIQSYQDIISMGEVAVPLLLKELEKNPDHYFCALRTITNVDPVRQSDRGNVYEMAQSWIKWGYKEDYLKEDSI